MRRLLTPVIIALAVVIAFAMQSGLSAAVPPRPEQPAPDLFEAPGIANLQVLNPVTVRAKAQHQASYQLTVMPGCAGETQFRADMVSLEQVIQRDFQFSLVRVDGSADFTVRLNCGSGQIAVCSSVTIFCLGRGFPYVADVEISDLMYAPVQWPYLTRISILCHEICGHAIATWNEQYCRGFETTGICRGLAQFASAPNWRDFMNTGPLSRHEPEVIEKERWSRTMFELAQALPFQDCTTYVDFPGTTSCWWPELEGGKWLWNLTLSDGKVQIWEWSPARPQWVCGGGEGCPR